MSSILDFARRDMQNITMNSNSGFAIEVIFKHKTTNQEITVKGIHGKHHLSIDTDGNAVNGRKAHVNVAEIQFIDAEYQIRNSKGIVQAKDHIIKCKDANGVLCTYTIDQYFPDETLGNILFILGQYKDV